MLKNILDQMAMRQMVRESTPEDQTGNKEDRIERMVQNILDQMAMKHSDGAPDQAPAPTNSPADVNTDFARDVEANAAVRGKHRF